MYRNAERRRSLEDDRAIKDHKLAFHDTNTDTHARIVAMMSVSAPWNASYIFDDVWLCGFKLKFHGTVFRVASL